MKLFTRFLVMYWVCILATGCIVQDLGESEDTIPTPEEEETPRTGGRIKDELQGVGCEQNTNLCQGNEVCTLVDPCGSSCDGEDPDAPCPQVCVEIYACLEPLGENEQCTEYIDQCATGLSCQIDHEADCVPSFCEGDLCTADCIAVFTCQPNHVQSCNPNEDENTCVAGEICGITDLHETECSPDGLCLDVGPQAIFGCVPVLHEGQECNDQHSSYGFNQCAEGLVCTYDSHDCGTTCDDHGNCFSDCSPPAPTCQPETIRSCNPALEGNECASDEICGVVGYGPECDENEACPQIEDYPIFGCVTALTEGEVCQEIYLGDDHCAAGLVCAIDDNGGCGPTDCFEDGCGECPTLFTCQAVDSGSDSIDNLK